MPEGQPPRNHSLRAESGEQEAAEWVDVVQRPGDVLWVPELWGHATLSLAESVAVAVEYV